MAEGLQEPEALRTVREAPEERAAPLLGQLQEGCAHERVAPRLEQAHALGALGARGDVRREPPALDGCEVTVDVREQGQLIRVACGHHRFDSVLSAVVPSLCASSLRPRKIRDFTVPSATPVSSAISA